MTQLRNRILAIAVLSLAPGNAIAQDTSRVPDPVLLKRIAEAVDGDRSGQLVYVVARYDSTSPVRGLYRERSAAEARARVLGRAYDVFGPYKSRADRLFEIVNPCPHDGRWSIFFPDMCPEEPGKRIVMQQDIRGMSLILTMKDGTTRTYPFAATVDAIFLTIPAIDKFAIPYYHGIIGVDSAAALRQQFARRFVNP